MIFKVLSIIYSKNLTFLSTFSFSFLFSFFLFLFFFKKILNVQLCQQSVNAQVEMSYVIITQLTEHPIVVSPLFTCDIVYCASCVRLALVGYVLSPCIEKELIIKFAFHFLAFICMFFYMHKVNYQLD